MMRSLVGNNDMAKSIFGSLVVLRMLRWKWQELGGSFVNRF